MQSMQETFSKVAAYQAGVQRYTRPAGLVSYCKGFHNASVAWLLGAKGEKKKPSINRTVETITTKSGLKISARKKGPGGVRRAVNARKRSRGKQAKLSPTEFQAEGLRRLFERKIGKELPKEVSVERNGSTVSVYLYSGLVKWLHAVDFTVEENPTPNPKMKFVLRANASSTGICPLGVPGAPLINLALFWAPFPDWGLNQQILEQLTKLLRLKKDWNIGRRVA